MANNQQVDIKIDKETYDALQMLKEVLPSEDSNEKMDDNELLKMIVGTFIAFIQGDDEEEEHAHDKCGCKDNHC